MKLLNTYRINKLINKIGSEFSHEIIPIKLEEYSLPLSCYTNVKQKISRDGGCIHYGWKVHFGDLIVEAERHAVWEDENEDLICITPDPKNKHEIVFISDNREVLDDQHVDNIRINITNRSIVDEWIKICEAVSFAYSELTVRKSDFEIVIQPEIKSLIADLEIIRDSLLYIIKKSSSNNPKCFCEGGYSLNKTFSYCHGPKAKEIIHTLKNLKK